MEPIAGAFHRRGVHRVFGGFPRRLGALENAQAALHEAHHGGGLGAAPAGGFGVGVRCDGRAKAVHGLGVGGDDLGGEQGFGDVGRVVGGDRGHGGFDAGFEAAVRAGGGRREGGAQGVEDVEGGGRREVGEGVGCGHGSGCRGCGWRCDVGVRYNDFNSLFW